MRQPCQPRLIGSLTKVDRPVNLGQHPATPKGKGIDHWFSTQ